MHTPAAIMGLALFVIVLWDTYETVILPRGVVRGLRLARLFYRLAWGGWTRLVGQKKERESLLAIFGPMSLLLLLAVWATCIVFSFALIHWGLRSGFNTPDGHLGFGTYLYVSGTTFFTLGLGDVTPKMGFTRFLVVFEGGMGFGFLALVIGYLPVLYQAFSRREVRISLLDARAGSPSSATEMLRRSCSGSQASTLERILADWELWAAELLESQISYPVLSYYRSQHERQSWLASLTTILDTCALLFAGVEGGAVRQSQLTFAMGRHAAVDLCLIFNAAPIPPSPDRLNEENMAQLRAALSDAGFSLPRGAEEKLAEVRRGYEPYVNALAQLLRYDLPPWTPTGEPDNWQTSAWEHGGHF